MPVHAYSAPGKALLAGGFLVLEPQYPSYVTALSARMHARIEDNTSASTTHSVITIKSPQFLGEWQYQLSPPYTSVNDTEGRKNPFIEATLKVVLPYVAAPAAKPFDLAITIFSDAGYHSQDATLPRTSANGSKTFLFHGKPIDQVAKTGLGSSAGLVSVLTTALLTHFVPALALDSHDSMRIVHNTAQIAHCYAQKKVGLGFDVATAIYGSIRYQRFSPQTIDDFFAHSANDEFDGAELKKLIEHQDAWKFTADPVTLPPGIKLLMGDIQGGSETPKLVGKVLAWKKCDATASEKLYRDLNNANTSLIESLTELHAYHGSDPAGYRASLEMLAKGHSGEVCSDGPFGKLIHAIKNIRRNLQQLTRFSGAEIEPVEQTRLLDHCSQLPGVLGGVVPGAGGYDAICLLVIEDSVSGVVGNESEELRSVTWLDLNEEAAGVVAEDVVDYEGL